MDLSNAFDSIPHGLLIAKLSAYGTSQDACELVRSYLTRRKQRVTIGRDRSSWLELKRGVPQGSLTGPVLFNIFLNDLLFTLEHICDVYNYADDNTLAFHHQNPLVVKGTIETASNMAIQWFLSKIICRRIHRNFKQWY